MKIFFKKWFAAALVGATLPSCFNAGDYDFDRLTEVKWNPEYAAPLVYGSLTIGHFLNEEDSALLREKEDGSLYLLFEDTLETRNLNDLVYIPNHTLQKSYGTPIMVSMNPEETYTIEEDGVIDLSGEPELSEEELYEAVIKDGVLGYDIFCNIDADVDVFLVFPTILDDGGQALELSVKIARKYYEFNKDLDGYTMDFTALTPAFNQLPFTFRAEIHSGSEPLTLMPGTFFELDLSFSDIEYDIIYGYFGQQEVEIPADAINVGLTGDSFDGMEITLADATIELEAINEYGAPALVVFDAFEARKDGQKMDVILSDDGGAIPVSAPKTPGESASTIVRVANAADVFNFKPDELYYATRARLNPDGRTDEDNFMRDNSRLMVRFRAEAPLYGSAKGISLNDTLEVSLGEDFDDTKVENALLKLKIVNEFPLQANVQIFFADEFYQVTGSMFKETQNIIVSSETDANGNLVPGGAGVYDDVIVIDKEDFNQLLKSKYLIVQAEMSTKKEGDNYPDVKLKKDYKLSVEMGLQTKFNFTF